MGEFLAAVAASGSGRGWTTRSGGAPTPFDAVDGHRLAGPAGSHPLASVGIDELVRPCSDAFDGRIELTGTTRVGEGIAGRLLVTALRDVRARRAALRLVGCRLSEQRRSHERRDSEGRVTHREEWVEVDGHLFEELPFLEPRLPTSLGAGERFEAEFNLPGPRLGPPTAHLGTSILAWALEARWDVPMRGDERISTLVGVRPHPDYLRSGAARLTGGSLHDAWSVGDATIAVSPLPPIPAGSDLEVAVTWPSAGSGRGGRLELQADIAGPNGISNLVLWSTALDPSEFRGGVTVRIPVPADAPPTVSADSVGIEYRVRALIDRQFRSDLAVERAIAVI